MSRMQIGDRPLKIYSVLSQKPTKETDFEVHDLQADASVSQMPIECPKAT